MKLFIFILCLGFVVSIVINGSLPKYGYVVVVDGVNTSLVVDKNGVSSGEAFVKAGQTVAIRRVKL